MTPTLRAGRPRLRCQALALLLAACFLVVSVILEEPPAGDRQHWLTRPISWRSLLAAKTLFVLVFINLPLLASQMTVLAWNEIAPLPHLGELIGRDVCVTASSILVAAAIAAVNRGLIEAVLTAVGLSAAMMLGILISNRENFMSITGIQIPATAALLLICLGGLTVLQYARSKDVGCAVGSGMCHRDNDAGPDPNVACSVRFRREPYRCAGGLRFPA